MSEKYAVIRVYPNDLERLRQMYPRYASDAERFAEIMEKPVFVTTLPRPADAQPVPVVQGAQK